MDKTLKGFMDFIREQGVVGLAVGIILGGAVSKIVASLVTDLVNPILGLILNAGSLNSIKIEIGSAQIMIGNFLSAMIDFLIIAFVVYYGIKALGLDKIDKKKG